MLLSRTEILTRFIKQNTKILSTNIFTNNNIHFQYEYDRKLNSRNSRHHHSRKVINVSQQMMKEEGKSLLHIIDKNILDDYLIRTPR